MAKAAKKPEPKTAGAEDIARVRNLFNGGEKAKACALADELDLSPDVEPEGMAAFRRLH